MTSTNGSVSNMIFGWRENNGKDNLGLVILSVFQESMGMVNMVGWFEKNWLEKFDNWSILDELLNLIRRLR